MFYIRNLKKIITEFYLEAWPQVIKLFSYSAQLRVKFQLVIKTKIPSNKEVSSFKSLRCCIYHAYKCLMPTIVGILTLMRRLNFVLSRVEYEKNL